MTKVFIFSLCRRFSEFSNTVSTAFTITTPLNKSLFLHQVSSISFVQHRKKSVPSSFKKLHLVECYKELFCFTIYIILWSNTVVFKSSRCLRACSKPNLLCKSALCGQQWLGKCYIDKGHLQPIVAANLTEALNEASSL